jgi:hypothetical protein
MIKQETMKPGKHYTERRFPTAGIGRLGKHHSSITGRLKSVSSLPGFLLQITSHRFD